MTNYRGLIFDDTRDGASDLAIEHLEAQLGARLPDDYRQFLKECNGGTLDYDVLATMSNGEEELLSFMLYGLQPGEAYESNPFELEQLRKEPGFPATGMLPIGRDGGASILLLDLREGRQDVGAMVAGLPAWTGRRQQGDEYVVLANTFNAYLDALHLSHERITEHIKHFIISADTIEATLAWLDQGSPGWRERYREVWNARVVDRPI
ncbi:SMI1/KNR4 family protein [Pseudomonas sp. 7P_10.2_Bac1]|uniref:SMI1/KNR4 family protein n=1 Tax=Pseudomonas sp. 7P_10.2_Bac1 TaxID=2971614 RepID=UPI0021C5A1B6|nr:SMI1/KNR4 family protein [Pseudomonas sp. 7P_10.2_Bac1]MCU1725969.1 SMI1/KNR4 family protein [Pseudomonas sp. 7P_10.2_Bac1]